MPIIRKMVQIGASKGVTLPKSWIEDAENTHGQKIEAIAMEINGLITLSPVFEPKTKKLRKVREAAPLKSNSQPNQMWHPILYHEGNSQPNPNRPKEDS